MAWTKKIDVDGVPIGIGHGVIFEMEQNPEWYRCAVFLNESSINKIQIESGDH